MSDPLSQYGDRIKITILPIQAVDEMVFKIVEAAKHPNSVTLVAAWRVEHGTEIWVEVGHDHAVVGNDLMYLHDAPDGTLIPHRCRPDGTEEIFTDAAHAKTLF